MTFSRILNASSLLVGSLLFGWQAQAFYRSSTAPFGTVLKVNAVAIPVLLVFGLAALKITKYFGWNRHDFKPVVLIAGSLLGGTCIGIGAAVNFGWINSMMKGIEIFLITVNAFASLTAFGMACDNIFRSANHRWLLA